MPFQSLAFGLLKFTKQEQPVPSEVSASATCPEPEGQHSVSKPLKLGSKLPPRPRSICPDCCRIFSDHNARAKLINNTDEFMAQ
jgi:hypothetical protein